RVAAGEYWRLLTAPWLHGGVDHLVGNGIALFILGMLCEAAFGRAQFVLLYVLSGLAGSLVSLAVSVGPSVGASGAIFGLQGAAIMLFRLHRDRLLVRDRRVGFVLLVWAIYSIAGGLMQPFIDNGAHIGGARRGEARERRRGPHAARDRASDRVRRRETQPGEVGAPITGGQREEGVAVERSVGRGQRAREAEHPERRELPSLGLGQPRVGGD